MIDVLKKIKSTVETDRESVSDNLSHIIEEAGELAADIRRNRSNFEEASDVVYEAMKMFYRLGGDDSKLEFLLLKRATKDKGKL